MKGRQILIEPLASGGHAAALMVDGRLQDLLIDPAPAEAMPHPEAIYRAFLGRPMKGLGGVMVELGGGQSGFLRSRRLPAHGRPLLVQVTGWAEPGKAPPVAARLVLKGRTAILTPAAPGINVARGLRDPERRTSLHALAASAMAGSDASLGLILRTAAGHAGDDVIAAEIAVLRDEWDALSTRTNGIPACVRSAPGAAAEALRDWSDGDESVREAPTALGDAGVWEEVELLRQRRVQLGQGSMMIEPTRALVAVDVNTGGDVSPSAGIAVSLAAAAELPRQLRLRGLGGQIAIDFAPFPRAERPRIERTLLAALRDDGIDTTLAGWTPLGHLELQRKRARRPL